MYLDGLSNITEVRHDLVIAGNLSLPTLSGLSGLSQVGGNVKILNNESLCQSSVSDFIADLSVDGEVENSANRPDC